MLSTYSLSIEALLHERVTSAGVAPGACAAVSVRTTEGWCTWLGASGTVSDHSSVRVGVATHFDLASLTKSLFAFALARQVDRGALAWSDPLQRHLPCVSDTFAANTPLELLLAHRSGLAAHIDLAAPLRAGMPWQPKDAWILAANSANPLRRVIEGDQFEAVYSDLGYVLAGEASSRTLGAPLDQIVRAELLALGLTGLGSARQVDLRQGGDVAYTEDVPWRGGRLRGVVHDDNAFALARDGCAGHAGFFGNVLGVARFATCMLDQQNPTLRCLSEESVQVLFRQRPGGTERAGFDGKNPMRSSLGARLGARTFGHYGFTGTGFWCDPDQDVAVVLLSNRVCPSRDNLAIRSVRPIIHDALVEIGLGHRRHAR